MRLRRLLCVGIIGMLPCLGANASLAYDLSEAINDAGRQRMLSQKMLKAYAQIRLGVDADIARSELIQAIDLYQQQHLNLQRGLNEEAVQKQLQAINELWNSYRQQLVSEDGSQHSLGQLSTISEELLTANNQLVQTLEISDGRRTGRLISLSGRQRMLSQRLAKLYLLSSLGNQQQPSEQLLQAQEEFSEIHGLLKLYTFGNLHIRDSLNQIESEWLWFQSVLEQNDGARYNLIVAEASKQLLLQLEQLTFLYQLEGQKIGK